MLEVRRSYNFLKRKHVWLLGCNPLKLCAAASFDPAADVPRD
ncbi:MAG: hypothetical protein WB686_12540 [Pseudolabrys sp.]